MTETPRDWADEKAERCCFYLDDRGALCARDADDAQVAVAAALRDERERADRSTGHLGRQGKLLSDAASEITRLRALLEEARGALGAFEYENGVGLLLARIDQELGGGA